MIPTRRILLAVGAAEPSAATGRVAAVTEALGADLLVVGSRGRSALDGTILGDTTRDILRRAACPVVVVPPRAAGP